MTDTAQAPEGIDPFKFRQTLGHYPTGVVVVTAVSPEGKPMAMVVGTFLSVSLDPPLVGFLPTKTSETFEQLRRADTFCINVLADDQEGLARQLARRDETKFDSVSWTPAPSGAPIIDGVVAAIDCSFDSITDAGDHYFVLAKVHELQVVNPVAPLLFFQGGYGSFTPLSMVAGPDAALINGVRLAELARREMELVAEKLDAECLAYVKVGDDVALVASAVAPGVAMLAQLGTRFPLMPPLGELFVAWEPEETIERWLDRAGKTADDEQRARYRERLDQVRDQGWAISLAGNTPDSKLYAAMRDYSERKVTPARLNELQEVFRDEAYRYEPGAVQDDQNYNADSLVVPVRDAEGTVVLVLRLSQMPKAKGSQFHVWADELLATAARVEQAIAAAPAAK